MRRATVTRLLALLTSTLLFASCQKEISTELPAGGNGGNGGSGGSGGSGNNTNNIVGDYDFVGMIAHTVSTVTINQAGQTVKTVTVSDYVTENNTGTVKITSNQFISTDNAYSVDTTMNAKTYMNGVLLDDEDLPFNFSSPPTSATSTYVRNSPDSITVTGNVGFPDPSGNTSTGSAGAKLSWHGDTLYMKVNTSFTQTITQGGVPAQFTGSVQGISMLKKK